VLNVETTAFPFIHMEASVDFDPEGEVVQSELKVDVQHNVISEDRLSMFVRAWLEMEEGVNAPYMIDVCCVGEFSFDPELFQDVRNKAFILRNAAGIIFASIREMVGIMTSRSPLATLILPSYYFRPEQMLTEDEAESLKDHINKTKQ